MFMCVISTGFYLTRITFVQCLGLIMRVSQIRRPLIEDNLTKLKLFQLTGTEPERTDLGEEYIH